MAPPIVFDHDEQYHSAKIDFVEFQQVFDRLKLEHL